MLATALYTGLALPSSLWHSTGQKRSSRVRQYLRRTWTDLDEIWNSVSQMWGMTMVHFGRDPRSSDSLRGIVFFPKKRKDCILNFPVLRLQAVITPHWLQDYYGMSSFHFCRQNKFNVFPLDCTLRTRKIPTQIFGNRWLSPWTSCWVMTRKLTNRCGRGICATLRQ